MTHPAPEPHTLFPWPDIPPWRKIVRLQPEWLEDVDFTIPPNAEGKLTAAQEVFHTKAETLVIPVSIAWALCAGYFRWFGGLRTGVHKLIGIKRYLHPSFNPEYGQPGKFWWMLMGDQDVWQLLPQYQTMEEGKPYLWDQIPMRDSGHGLLLAFNTGLQYGGIPGINDLQVLRANRLAWWCLQELFFDLKAYALSQKKARAKGKWAQTPGYGKDLVDPNRSIRV